MTVGFREDHHLVVLVKSPDCDLPYATTIPLVDATMPSVKGGSSKHPAAVTIKDHVIVLNVHSNKKSVSHGFFAHIFSTLDK